MTISDFDIPIPKDWQRFERLCHDLWKEIFQDPLTQMHGRSGQSQSGVDVFGCINGNKDQIFAIQCKGKNNYNRKGVTKQELKKEVELASNFRKNLKLFILCTTAPNDVHIQKYAEELGEKYDFRIEVFGWDQICQLFDKHRNVFDIHYSGIAPSTHQNNLLINNEHNKNYSDVTSKSDQNKLLIEYWYKTYIGDEFEAKTIVLANGTYNIEYDESFLTLLAGFASYLRNIRLRSNSEGNDHILFNMLSSFCLCVTNINQFITSTLNSSAMPRIHSKNDLYWVLDEDVPYYLRGEHVETQKLTLRYLFVDLIKITNTILNHAAVTYDLHYQIKFCIDGCGSHFYPSYDKDEPYMTLDGIKLKAKNQVSENRF